MWSDNYDGGRDSHFLIHGDMSFARFSALSFSAPRQQKAYVILDLVNYHGDRVSTLVIRNLVNVFEAVEAVEARCMLMRGK